MSKLNALFIDPYKMRVDPIIIENTLQAWYAAMCCDFLDVVRLGLQVNDLKIDLWVDGRFALRKPQPPGFQIKGQPLAGLPSMTRKEV
jgi:hypothetical protein